MNEPAHTHIHEDLRHLAVPVGDLVLDPANVRKHPTRNLEAIRGSLAKFGQRKPIVVQKEGMVVRAGNGTLEAAKALGWEHIAALVVDENDVQATAFAIADNRTGELAEWDYQELGVQLEALQNEGFDLGELGWADFEVGPLLAAEWTPAEIDPDFVLGGGEGGGGALGSSQTGKVVVLHMTDEQWGEYETLDNPKLDKVELLLAALREADSDA